MKLDDILNQARSRTKLPDPDRDTWREGLEILLDDHERQDCLSERGRSMIAERYVGALAARMTVDEHLRRAPEITRHPVQRPVFILGLPRTGTTVVSYLMDADPANRSLLKWEAYNVAPPAAPGELRSDPRCLAELAKDQKIIAANPQGVAQHFEAGDGPTECVHLLAQDYRSLMLAVLSDVPTYHDWLLSCDMTTAFAHRKRAMQILQSTNPGRWVLKMPSDSLFIRTLFKTFPDAKIIWTHRDPLAAFASSMSMRRSSRLHYNKDAGLDYMRNKFPLQLAMHVARPLEVSQERPDDFMHVYYDDLLADPMAQMRRIYAWLGDDLSETAEHGMRGWLERNPQNRFGAHRYSLDEWGFDRKQLTAYFSDYLKSHPVASGSRRK